MRNIERGEFLIEQSILLALRECLGVYFSDKDLNYTTAQEALDQFVAGYKKADIKILFKHDGIFDYADEPITIILHKNGFKFQFATIKIKMK